MKVGFYFWALILVWVLKSKELGNIKGIAFHPGLLWEII